MKEDNDNIYILEEEENDPDQSPLNYAAYTDEERDKDSEETLKVSKGSAIGFLFRILFNPVEGWKKLRRSGLTIEELQGGCFYPLLALLAVAKFADYFYSVNVSLSQLVTEAVVAFVAFFFGYFSMNMILSIVLPKEMAEKFNKGFGKEYCLISLSSLAFFSIFTEILPMLWPILIFLPIWTLYIMFKGVKFFKFTPDKELKFYVYAASSAIGIPLLIDWVLNSVLPY